MRLPRRALAALPLAAGIARAAEPRRLIGAIEEEPPFFNPAISSTISSFVAGTPVYSALTRLDGQGNITGDLAESWTISPDGMTYTFKLRSGITWHDGKPFTAADVAFSLGTINSKMHPYRGAMKAIEAFEAPDDLTFVMRLKHPQGSLLITLGNFCGAILPKHLWEGTDPARNPHNRKPIGTGAFALVEYVPGDRILYRRYDKYFLPGKPAYDELMLRIIPDPSARIAAFENGDLDMLYANAIPSAQVERLRRMPGVALKFNKVQASGYQAYINMRSAPYSDRRVRHALAHAIDRAFIRNTVFPNLAENMVGPVPPSSPLYNKALPDYALDPAKANALLDTAGFARGADGVRFPLRYLFGANDLPAARIGDIMSRNLAAVGIRVVQRPLDRGAFLQLAFLQNEFDMVAGSFSLGPDPDVGIERFYNSNNIVQQPFANNSPYVNPEVDKLFDEQRVQLGPVKRKAIYDRIQELIWADIPVFPFCAYQLPGVVRARDVAGVFYGESTARDDFVLARPTR